MVAVISVENLVKRYEKATTNAVDGVSFKVYPGQLFALLGPNGAGKTTTLSILTTTLSKTKGRVMISGFDVDKQANEVRRTIGVIFQNPSLDLNLTAEENIRFHATLYGIYSFRPTFRLMDKGYQKRVYNLAEILGIKKEIFDPVRTFSGGMKRKLEIVRGPMHEPRVLFLDEPTTGLDPLSRKNLWDYLTDMRGKLKTTLFLTTHYLEEAESADDICVINKGKVIAQGTPEDFKRKLREEYLVLDAKDRKRLMKELGDLDLKVGAGFPVKVCPGKLTLQQIIKKVRTPLSVFEIHAPTLEEAYLKIVQDDEGN